MKPGEPESSVRTVAAMAREAHDRFVSDLKKRRSLYGAAPSRSRCRSS